MNQRINELKKELQELIGAQTCTVTPEMELIRELKYKEAKRESKLHGKSYSIVDLKEGRFAYHVSAHDKWLSAPVIDINEPNNLEQIYNLTHPDDLQKVIENELRGINFMLELPIEKKEDFQFLYMRRLLDKSGNFQLCLHRLSVAVWDETGKPWLLQNCTEKLPGYFKNLSQISEFYLLFPLTQPNRKKREIFVNNIWLTEQELNILQLVYDGRNQLYIAKKNFISVRTVKTHFTTIRMKLNMNNIHMASVFAKLTGILMQLLFLWIEWGEDIEEIMKGI